MTDARDIVERLRDAVVLINESYNRTSVDPITDEAADLIDSLRADLAATKDALDMATQGKYSALMLELANGRAKQLHDAIQVGTLGGELSDTRAALLAANEEIERLKARLEAINAALTNWPAEPATETKT